MNPYRTTPVFDADTLPAALRAAHKTKPGVWGIVRVIEGELRLEFRDDQPGQTLKPGQPGLILPEQLHWVTPLGSMQMRVEFYDARPYYRIGTRP